MALPDGVRDALAPLRALLRHLEPAIRDVTAEAQAAAAEDAVVRRLMTVPGVGAITGLSFRATVEDIARLRDARSASAFFGLVPSEDRSADRRHRGRITKAGPTGPRSLLIQAAWVAQRHPARASGALHAWVRQLADRRGKRIAVVALARRLTRILYAIWRDGTEYRITPAPA